jgi:hypothetical protein
MISPLPRNKRAKHPGQLEGGTAAVAPARLEVNHHSNAVHVERHPKTEETRPVGGFSNNPFAQLEAKR